ncbi:MAG: tRNA lysidine(34) synthetase TilS [Epulopiscium sp. Nele67-Bin004]|nr:MAG: tRNA lysidine(34) synthetase TilS [Epulopiscium sp. Nele67-Bin004]
MNIREIENKVEKFILKHNLISDNDKIIVAVSGGADSMMLLHFLSKRNVKLTVAHVNHMMRIEAEAEAKYVRSTCASWGIPCVVHTADIKELAKQQKISLEECGRQERYNFFISLSNNNDKIATAHNANDQAETMIMRFFRGTDVKGLGGIPIIRDKIIRPIICLNRDEIEYYCKVYEIKYKDDHTNFLPIYTRNKIRLELIPYIVKNINKNIVYTLLEHSQLYKEEEDFLMSYISDCYKKYVTLQNDIYEVKNIHKEKPYIQKKLMLQILVELGIYNKVTSRHLEDIIHLIDGPSGKKINLPSCVVVYKSQKCIRIFVEQKTVEKVEMFLKIGSNSALDYEIFLKKFKANEKTIEVCAENRYTKYIDYDKIECTLKIRTRTDGDKITLPSGQKKLKKLFNEDKVPLDIRNQIPIIVDGNNVVLVAGSRLSSAYYVDKNTKNILEITLVPKK